MFGYELYILIAKFFSYPATVSTDILFKKQPFPVVTVCNLNPYKYTIVKTSAPFSNVNSLMTVYTNAATGTYENDKWGLYEAKNESYDLDSRAADALVLEANLISDADKETAMYTYDDLIQDCSFAGLPCSVSDFKKYIDPVYGACYSFNEDASLNYSVSREGIQFGLKLMITVMTQNIRAKRPYGKCVDREPESTDYYKDYTYTLETCFNGCKQRNTVSKCNCANPIVALGPSDTACQPTKADLDCLQTLKGDQKDTDNPNIDLLTECSCSSPCQESVYTPTVSLAKFPSSSYYVATSSTKGVGSCSSSNSNFATKSACQQWYNSNGLILQVFFETLSYELFTESASYTVSNVINDLGGQAGLWLGLSVISVVEMTGLLLVMGAFCVSGGAIKIAPDDDEIENDHRIKDVEDVKKEIDEMEKHHEGMETDDDGGEEGDENETTTAGGDGAENEKKEK
uniref:Uncharacterized protein n=1 Tax=Caenorhabditis japonica TaxID=281687 RepID=A0A8R1DVG6_CAEJA